MRSRLLAPSSISRRGSRTCARARLPCRRSRPGCRISDVLEVEAQLTNVRGQIEQLTAQLTQLNDQASYATMTASFSVPVVAVRVATESWEPAKVVDEATASLVDILQALTTAGIWFAIVWLPVLLLLGGITGLVVFVLRRLGDPHRPQPGRRARRRLEKARRRLARRRAGPTTRSWHDGAVTEQAKADAEARRFDEIAGGYERWWAPVLAPSARTLLDQLAPAIEGGAVEILDVGVGTGNLARPALARWPGIRVTGLDASREMVETVERLIEVRRRRIAGAIHGECRLRR